MLDELELACLDELGRMPERPQATDDSLVERLALEERRLCIQARLLWIDYARHELRAGGEWRRRAEVAGR
ncbi:MAG: hypothetical protein ACJ76L_03290, partial [Conexibacter sp.]